jgi:chromosome segregation ATPase
LKTIILAKWKQKLIYLFLLPGLMLLLSSCSSESFTQQENEKQTGEQTLTFSEEENGKDVHYEVNFKNGEISSVYKDNIKIPENEIKNYQDLINDKLSSLRKDDDDFYVFRHKPHSYHFDMKEFKENMKDWKEKFKGDQFKFEFDKEKFKADMDKLKEELKDMDEIVIKIDRDKIKKELDGIKIPKFNFDFDTDELNENMKRITIEIEKNQDELEFNMDELMEEMEQLDEEMKDLSKEMEKLDKEMKILDNFLNDVKEELVKDGLIKNSDEEFKLKLSKDEMEINGEKVSGALHSKYKELYKKHYNKELNEKVEFRIK